MQGSRVMKYVKVTGLVALAVAFIALIVALIWHANHRNVVEKEESSSGFRWTDEASRDQPATVENPVTVSDEELSEIYDFMNYFMTFPVVWDFNQQSMSGAVDYFTQKCIWTDVSAMEYDAEAHAFYVNADDFAKEMGQYFVMSDSALKSIDAKAIPKVVWQRLSLRERQGGFAYEKEIYFYDHGSCFGLCHACEL